MLFGRFRYESMSFRDLLSHRHGLRTESWGSSAGAFKDIEEITLFVFYIRGYLFINLLFLEIHVSSTRGLLTERPLKYIVESNKNKLFSAEAVTHRKLLLFVLEDSIQIHCML